MANENSLLIIEKGKTMVNRTDLPTKNETSKARDTSYTYAGKGEYVKNKEDTTITTQPPVPTPPINPQTVNDISQTVPASSSSSKSRNRDENITITTIAPEHETVSISTEEEHRRVFTPQRIFFSSNPSFKPEKEGDVVVYKDSEGKLTGESSAGEYYDLSQLKGYYVDTDAVAKFIKSNPIDAVATSTTVNKGVTIPSTIVSQTSTLTPQAVPSPFTNSVNNPQDILFGANNLYRKKAEDVVMSNVEKGLYFVPNFVTTKARELGIGDIPAEHVVVAEKKFFPTGTAAYNPSTKSYYLPPAKTNPVVNVEYDAKGANIAPEILGGLAAAGEVALAPEAFAATSGVVGVWNIGRGVEEKNTGRIIKGGLQVTPAIIYGGAKLYKYYTEPISTTETLYPVENKQVNFKGKLGEITFTPEEARGAFWTSQEMPNYLTTTTTRLRNLFGLQPSSVELYYPIEASANANIATTRAIMISPNDLYFSKGATYSQNVVSPEQLKGDIDSGIYFTPTRSVGSEFEPITPENLEFADTKTRMLLGKMQAKFGVTVSGEENAPQFFRYGSSSEISKLPMEVGVQSIEKATYYRTPEGTLVDNPNLLKDLYLVRGAAIGRTGEVTYQSLLVKATQAPSMFDDVGYSIIIGRGQSSNLPFQLSQANLPLQLSQENIVRLTSTIPPATHQPPILDIPKPDITSFELAPKIVGGLGQEASWYYGKGGVNSNGGNFGKLTLKPVTDYPEKTVTFNLGRNFIDTTQTDETKLDVSQPTKDETSQGGGSRHFNKDVQVNPPNENQNTFQDIVQIPRLNQNQKLSLKLEEPTKLRGIRTPPFTLIPPIIAVPKAKKSSSSVLSRLRAAYNVAVFRSGRPEIIAKRLPFAKAEKVGVQNVISNLRASFKLIPAGTTSEEDIFYKLPSTFRPSKVEKNRFVQKLNTRFGARGETSEAQFFRKAKARKIKWF